MNERQSPRMASESFLVCCVTITLPVCGMMEAIPLIKHSVTFTNYPYPLLLQFTKSVLDLIVLIHRIHCSINTLKISITTLVQRIAIFKKIWKYYCMGFFFCRVYNSCTNFKISVKPVLSGHSKIDKTKVFNNVANGGAFCNTFDLH